MSLSKKTVTNYRIGACVNYEELRLELHADRIRKYRITANGEQVPVDFTEEEIDNMMDHVYREQLLVALGVDLLQEAANQAARSSLSTSSARQGFLDVNEEYLFRAIDDLWPWIRSCEELMNCLKKIRDQYFFVPISIPTREQWVEEGNDAEDYEHVFDVEAIRAQNAEEILERNSIGCVLCFLFGRDLFHTFHPIIAQLLSHGQVSDSSLSHLQERADFYLLPEKRKKQETNLNVSASKSRSESESRSESASVREKN